MRCRSRTPPKAGWRCAAALVNSPVAAGWSRSSNHRRRERVGRAVSCIGAPGRPCCGHQRSAIDVIAGEQQRWRRCRRARSGREHLARKVESTSGSHGPPTRSSSSKGACSTPSPTSAPTDHRAAPLDRQRREARRWPASATGTATADRRCCSPAPSTSWWRSGSLFIEMGPTRCYGSRSRKIDAGSDPRGDRGDQTLRRDRGQRASACRPRAGAHPRASTRLRKAGQGPANAPAHHPFERGRFWIEAPTGHAPTSAAGLPRASTDPGRRPPETRGRRVSTPARCRSRHPWLADHAVAGKRLLPGTAFLQLRAASHCEAKQVNELTLEVPPIIGEGEEIARGSTSPAPRKSGEREISIHSRSLRGQAEWIRHAAGTLCVERPSNREPARLLAPRGTGSRRPTHLTLRLDELGFEYGPAFQRLERPGATARPAPPRSPSPRSRKWRDTTPPPAPRRSPTPLWMAPWLDADDQAERLPAPALAVRLTSKGGAAFARVSLRSEGGEGRPADRRLRWRSPGPGRRAGHARGLLDNRRPGRRAGPLQLRLAGTRPRLRCGVRGGPSAPPALDGGQPYRGHPHRHRQGPGRRSRPTSPRPTPARAPSSSSPPAPWQPPGRSQPPRRRPRRPSALRRLRASGRFALIHSDASDASA